MKKSSNLQYLFDVEYYKCLLNESESEAHMKECKNALINSKLKKSSGGYEELDKLGDIVSFRLKTCAPGLLIGIGNAHGTKGEKEDIQMGMSMDYVTGYPYIPGSTVKGIIRSGFKKFEEEICKWLGGEYESGEKKLEDLERQLFEPDSKKDFEEKDLFFDAYIVDSMQSGQKFLDTDNITPHIDKKNPAESIFKSPDAVTTMLKVRPDVVFEFKIRISGDGEIEGSEKNRRELYQSLLCELGIGAKTNLGYGIVELDRQKIKLKPESIYSAQLIEVKKGQLKFKIADATYKIVRKRNILHAKDLKGDLNKYFKNDMNLNVRTDKKKDGDENFDVVFDMRDQTTENLKIFEDRGLHHE